MKDPVHIADSEIAGVLRRREGDGGTKDYYLWVYVYDKAGKQEEWYPKTTCLPEMRGWLCSVTPCNTPEGKGTLIIDLNKEIKAYAGKKGFAYCDLSQGAGRCRRGFPQGQILAL